jgi:2Fe-2S ferredoxin
MSELHKVTIRETGRVLEVDQDTNLLEAFRKEQIYIKSSCGGVGTCSDCIIKVVGGADNIEPPSFSELALLGNVFHITKERLACQTTIKGDVMVDITRHDKGTDQNKLKNKTSQFVKKNIIKRKPEDRPKPAEKRPERPADDSWSRHWEKDKKDGPKRLGGNKRPKPFKYDEEDDKKED